MPAPSWRHGVNFGVGKSWVRRRGARASVAPERHLGLSSVSWASRNL